MDDDYEDEPSFEPTAKDELTAIRHTLKRMEKRQNDFWNLLVYGSIALILLYHWIN